MPLYEYKCESCNTVVERVSSVQNRHEPHMCDCGSWMRYKISPVRFHLDGTDPGYPTAWDQWEKKRNQKIAQENKQNS